jgi:hypothetical protein
MNLTRHCVKGYSATAMIKIVTISRRRRPLRAVLAFDRI